MRFTSAKMMHRVKKIKAVLLFILSAWNNFFRFHSGLSIEWFALQMLSWYDSIDANLFFYILQVSVHKFN